MSDLIKKYWKPALIAGGTVVVLALVVLVGSSFSKPHSDEPNRLGANATQQNADLLERAEAALSSGDTTSAVTLARRVLQSDPSNQRAIVVVQTAEAGQDAAAGQNPEGASSGGQPGSSSADGSTSVESTATNAAFLKKVDFIALVPKKFPGYSMGEPASDTENVDISATPMAASAPAFRVAWAVHDKGSANGAADFMKKTSMVLYPKSPDTKLSVDGATAYFGTDGTELATVSYRRGRYVFEVVVVAQTRGKPEKLRSLAIEAAKAFGDEPVTANGG